MERKEMVDSMDEERIMERVRRLLALANDPAASDNEQRIALEQAQRLMDKHAIEEWQLEENHDDVEIIKRRIRLETNPCNRYMAQLANIVARGYQILRLEMESDGTGKELVTVRSGQVDQWIETHVTFIADKPKLFKATRPSQAAYRHGRQDGARQAIGLKETGAAGNWTLEK